MNVYDSARMADVLAPLGYQSTDVPQGADMVILNTCHIREKASEKVYSELGRLRLLKDQYALSGGTMVIAVAGCVAQAEGEEIRRRAPYVDIVFGPQAYHRLPEMLARATRAATPGRRSGAGVMDTSFPTESKFDHLPGTSGGQGISAFLSVQEGCDKFCTFCVVPYTRGAEFSRPVAQIADEARDLIATGTVELTLLGQNVNAYHGVDDQGIEVGLAGLIRHLAAIPGLERIRYTTSHPRDMDDDLIAAHGQVDELMPYVHLPVQSGSDRMLAAMNRGHDVDDYRRVIDRLRASRPDLALSSDFIIGFPGETDADFAATMALVGEIGYAQAYSFKYSVRPGTPAAGLPGQVPEAAMDERLAALQELLVIQQQQFNDSVVGQTFDVLLERPGRREGQLLGRSPYNQAVHVTAPQDLLGTLASVQISRCKKHSLEGILAPSLRAIASSDGASPEVASPQMVP